VTIVSAASTPRSPGATLGRFITAKAASFFDPPLDCDLAQILYVDAACQTHPPCSTSTPP